MSTPFRIAAWALLTLAAIILTTADKDDEPVVRHDEPPYGYA